MHRHCVLSFALILMMMLAFLSPYAQARRWIKKWKWSKQEKKEIEQLIETVKREDGWFVLETKNWHVRCQLDAKFTAELAVYLELFVTVFEEAFEFPNGYKTEMKPTFYMFDSEEGYQQFTSL